MVDLITLSIFLAVASALALWAILRHLRIQLRQPPNKFLEITAISYKNGAKLPQEIKTPQLRRQLILASSRPAALTNMLDMGVETLDLTKVEKRPLIYGFFHPKADAGGGGERVLWAAVKQLTSSDPKAVAAIYVEAKKGLTHASILEHAAERFDLRFSAQEANRIVLIALTQTWLVDPSTYLALTLISQAVGMAVLGYEAIANLMPDVFVDTTGLAFSYPIVKWFAQIPILTYTHYPFVQSEMLNSIKSQGLIKSPKRLVKYVYYLLLTQAYRWAGSYADVVSVNSTWTSQHLGWKNADTTIVYPPCAVQGFAEPDPSAERANALVYLAQFRPEKRHDLVIKSFAKARAIAKKSHNIPSKNRKPHLILIGSVRDEIDALRVHELRTLASDLGLTDNDYTIVENAPWEAVKRILMSSLIGLNAMWNEHFGMGVVELMAGGLIPVVHASAGPLLDIVKDDKGAPGFFFRSSRDPDGLGLNGYPTLSEAIIKALSLSPAELKELSLRAYRASQRFSDPAFAAKWAKQIEHVTALKTEYARKRKALKLFD